MNWVITHEEKDFLHTVSVSALISDQFAIHCGMGL